MPDLRSLIIADSVAAWRSAGFTVDDATATTSIGGVTIELVSTGDSRGIVGWRFDGLGSDPQPTIDGVATFAAARGDHEPTREASASAVEHENLVSHLDHVVMFTPDIQRTIAALESVGFEARRTRDIPGSEPLRQQVFFWAGPTIIELVGPAEATGSEPASLWGLAVTCDDLDLAHDRLGGGLGNPKPAVQRGRRIATLRTRDLDISTAIAFMTPHVSDSSPSTPDA